MNLLLDWGPLDLPDISMWITSRITFVFSISLFNYILYFSKYALQSIGVPFREGMGRDRYPLCFIRCNCISGSTLFLVITTKHENGSQEMFSMHSFFDIYKLQCIQEHCCHHCCEFTLCLKSLSHSLLKPDMSPPVGGEILTKQIFPSWICLQYYE